MSFFTPHVKIIRARCKMGKYKIPIIALAIFSMSLLLMFSFFTEPAYALSSYTISLTDNAFVKNHSINGVSVFTSIDSSTGNTYKTWRASDGVVLYSGDSDNACTSAGLACTYNDMDCSGDACYLHADVASNDRIVKLIPSTGVDTIAVATGESSTSNEYLLFNSALWLGYINGANEKLRKVPLTFDVADFVDTADLNVPLLKPIAGQVISGTGYILLGGSTLLDIINTSTMTVKCQFGTVDNYLGGVFHNNNWYVGEDSGSVRVINNSCALQSTITSATLNTCGTSQDVASNGDDLIFVACDTAGTNNRIVVYNTTSNTVASVIPCAGNSAWGDSQVSEIDYSSSQDAISCSTFDTDSLKTILLGAPEEPEPVGNQQNGFCGNGTLRDCMGDSNALSGLVPANENITSVGTTICQGIGLCSPDDENPRTNGTGLFLMLITGSFFAIALMSTVHTLNMRGYISASVKEIDPIFWLFLVVGTVSVAWYLDWIDDIIFAAMTVGLAGLVAFGVLKHFGRI
jgi:hypothetical protein